MTFWDYSYILQEEKKVKVFDTGFMFLTLLRDAFVWTWGQQVVAIGQ